MTSATTEIGNRVADLHSTDDALQSLAESKSATELDSRWGYFAELSPAKNVADFRRRIDHAVKQLGFSEFAFVRLESVREPGELTTIAPEMLEAYYTRELYADDLGLQYANNNVQPTFRSTINRYVFQAPFDLDHTRSMREIDELHKSFGYHDFYYVPAAARNGNGSVLLTITQRGLTQLDLQHRVEGCYTDFQLLCEAIDIVMTRQFADDLLAEETKEKRVISVNPKPLKILDALANSDLNITQVANEFGINVVTANRHLQIVRKACGVKTNIAAIKQAVLYGLIEYKR